jgi:HxlR-like helix-turn-helix
MSGRRSAAAPKSRADLACGGSHENAWVIVPAGAAVYPEVPVRVEYALTEAGRTLREPLRALEEWSIAHLGDVSASQEAYDRAHTT